VAATSLTQSLGPFKALDDIRWARDRSGKGGYEQLLDAYRLGLDDDDDDGDEYTFRGDVFEYHADAVMRHTRQSNMSAWRQHPTILAESTKAARVRASAQMDALCWRRAMLLMSMVEMV